jgi:hypothetical protein
VEVVEESLLRAEGRVELGVARGAHEVASEALVVSHLRDLSDVRAWRREVSAVEADEPAQHRDLALGEGVEGAADLGGVAPYHTFTVRGRPEIPAVGGPGVVEPDEKRRSAWMCVCGHAPQYRIDDPCVCWRDGGAVE